MKKALEKMLILALYMPMVADTGGNVGSQAANGDCAGVGVGRVQRARMAKSDLERKPKVSSLLALCFGLVSICQSAVFYRGKTQVPAEYSLVKVAFVISLALSLQVITATVIGAALPLIVKAFGGDPCRRGKSCNYNHRGYLPACSSTSARQLCFFDF
jgi:magnesium transporter